MKVTLELETGDKISVEQQNALNVLLGNIKMDATQGVNEEKKEATEPPKRTRRTKAQIEADKEPEEETEAPTEEGITLTALKNRAKDAVAKTDRVKVKAVISEFAEKLADVDPADYERLCKKLGEL